MRNQIKLILVAASLLMFWSKTSHATPITVYVRDGVGGVNSDNQPGGVFLANAVVKDADKIQGNKVPAGTFSLEMSFNNPNGPYLPLLTYCGDPYSPLKVSNPGSLGGAFTPRTLSDFGYAANVVNALDLLWANAFTDSLTSATKAAAFQTLIWEYVGDVNKGNPFNLNAGDIRTNNNAVAAQAASWNAALSTWTTKSNLMIFDGRDAGKQSLFYDAGAGVPEPSTYAMIAAGLAALAMRRKRSA